MKTAEHTLDGKRSPWGIIDCSEEIADGIWQVMTPGHGGIWLSPSRRQQMPAYLRNWTSKYGDVSNGWYEEDCDWVVPCLAFPEEFGDRSYQIALERVHHDDKGYYPSQPV
jgi:hypothetical protein